jgi:hypothetical protein
MRVLVRFVHHLSFIFTGDTTFNWFYLSPDLRSTVYCMSLSSSLVIAENLDYNTQNVPPCYWTPVFMFINVNHRWILRPAYVRYRVYLGKHIFLCEYMESRQSSYI